METNIKNLLIMETNIKNFMNSIIKAKNEYVLVLRNTVVRDCKQVPDSYLDDNKIDGGFIIFTTLKDAINARKSHLKEMKNDITILDNGSFIFNDEEDYREFKLLILEREVTKFKLKNI